MQEKIRKFKTGKSFSNSVQFYISHASIINSVIENVEKKLSNKEIEVIANFMALDTQITLGDILNNKARKIVKEALKMSSASLSNHVKSLISKGVIIKDEETERHSFAAPYKVGKEDTHHYEILLHVTK